MDCLWTNFQKVFDSFIYEAFGAIPGREDFFLDHPEVRGRGERENLKIVPMVGDREIFKSGLYLCTQEYSDRICIVYMYA